MRKHPSLLTMLAFVLLALVASQSVTAEGEFETALKLKNKGDYNAAIEHLLSAVALDPKLTKAHFELGTMADIWCGGDDLYHRCELALKEYKKVLEIEPLREDAVNNLAYALYQRGNVDEAESYYRKALFMDRNDPEAMCGIAAINHQRSLLVEATARCDNHLEFRQPLIASPSCWMVREKNLARVDEAISLLRVARETRKQSIELVAHLAALYRARSEIQCESPKRYRADKNVAAKLNRLRTAMSKQYSPDLSISKCPTAPPPPGPM